MNLDKYLHQTEKLREDLSFIQAEFMGDICDILKPKLQVLLDDYKEITLVQFILVNGGIDRISIYNKTGRVLLDIPRRSLKSITSVDASDYDLILNNSDSEACYDSYWTAIVKEKNI